ncbi:MAG TPA: peptidase [Cytophagales bacterium]|nr:peptidase [Cytophagales bacterium]
MKQQQLIIGIAAIVFVGILYSLPKVLLNKEEKELENTAQLDKKEKSSILHPTPVQVSFSASEKSKVQKWKLGLVSSNSRIKLSILDSLSSLYNSKSLYDSTAFVFEGTLSSFSDVDSWVKIGDACYKAYYFAANDDKAADWATKTQQYYSKALEKKPELLDVKARMAMTYTRGQNPMKAVMTLREVLEKDPKNEQALLNIGLLSVQSGQFEKAVERFKKLQTINPENWLGTFYLGIAYTELGKKNEAKECFEKVKRNEKQPQILEAVDDYLKQLSVNP